MKVEVRWVSNWLYYFYHLLCTVVFISEYFTCNGKNTATNTLLQT